MGEEQGAGRAPGKRAQIALEFMVVYSIVLIIFVIVFALIANERSVALAQQQSMLMQLLSQNVAGYINQALQSGSGYSISAPLGAGVGYIPYNVSISTTGIVFVNTTVGKERIVGEASSGARNLVINGTQVASSNGITLYRLSLYSGYIYISNNGGSIYINRPAPALPSLPGNLTLTQQAALDAPMFSPGSKSFVNVPGAQSLDIKSSFTVSAWVYMSGISSYADLAPVSNPIAGEYSGASAKSFLLSVASYGTPVIMINGRLAVQGSTALSANVLYNIAATYNSSSSTATIYVNGVKAASGSSSGSLQGLANFTIGGDPYIGTYFNGYIFNVQLYNSTVPPQQVAAMYAAGPVAGPVSMQGNLIGWWPLNGNYNDYSGGGNPGAPSNTVLQPAVPLMANVTSFGGVPLASVPLGFWSSNSLIGGGSSLTTATGVSGMTGINGSQSTLLASGSFTGRANVQAIYYNGNLSVAYGKLRGWWPLNIGTSDTAYEYSGHSSSGAFSHVSYGQIANLSATLAGRFNGASSSISVANAPYLNPQNITITAWFNHTSTSQQTILAKYNSASTGDDYDLYYGTAFGTRLTTPSGTASYQVNNPYNSINGWYFGAMSYRASTGTISLYMNGNLIGTSTSAAAGPLSSSNSPLTIGYGAFGPSYWSGNISNVQIYNGTLSASQIAQLFSQGMAGAPANGAGLVGWWPLDGGSNSYASLPYQFATTTSGVTYNGVVYARAPPARNAPLFPLFDGANTVVTLPSGALPGACYYNITETAWVYDAGLAQAYGSGIVNFSNGGSSFYNIRANNNNVYYTIDAAGVEASFSTQAPHSLKDAWTFVAATVGHGGAYEGYVNGVPMVSGTDSGAGCIGLTTGKFGYDGAGYFNGSIVDVQLFNRTLDAAQLAQLYQQGFPVPVSMNISVG